jgi:hypothetical protein
MALFTGITAGGVSVRTGSTPWSRLVLQNVGTVPIGIWFNADGTGDPIAQLAGGVANDDGLGSSLTDNDYNGPVWAKAAAGGGRLLAT